MTGWLVAYTKKTKKGKLKDKFEVFIEGRGGLDHRDLARLKFQKLLTKKSTYSANVCHIKDSSEAHYLDIFERELQKVKNVKNE